ncbi:hypothetical protein BT93_L5869 [Corymbia citriodora subsp. variegata]|uniref:GDSL esterase/lipase n=1 Tax=Corymbia citriodora subsp. variegata TaxID=360336 RepID=A0A8T0CSD0_CORYI|nr:hypothetical protein BT93_L5869 [Corymbia citriodora subsp. variegata]
MLSAVSLSFEFCSCFASFVFGDSFVDSGHNDCLLTLSGTVSTPYGIDFKQSGVQLTGRFTNGLTIVDMVGQALGEESFAPPFLAPNSQEHATIFRYCKCFHKKMDLLRRNDVATRSSNSNIKTTRIPLNSTSIQHSQLHSCGSCNDIIYYAPPPVPYLSAQMLPPTMYQSFMISNLTLQLRMLCEMGGRKSVVVGIRPVGCIPFVRALNLFFPGGSCVVQVNQFIQGYNKKLKELLDELTKKEIMKPWFENANAPCCGGFFPPFDCYNATLAMCGDQSKYVSWDAHHLTEAANVAVAQELLDGNQTRSYPINIPRLYNYHFPS